MEQKINEMQFGGRFGRNYKSKKKKKMETPNCLIVHTDAHWDGLSQMTATEWERRI